MTKKAAPEPAQDSQVLANDDVLRPYFFPETGKVIHAKDIAEATELLNAVRGTSDNEPPRKEGDGN